MASELADSELALEIEALAHAEQDSKYSINYFARSSDDSVSQNFSYAYNASKDSEGSSESYKFEFIHALDDAKEEIALSKWENLTHMKVNKDGVDGHYDSLLEQEKKFYFKQTNQSLMFVLYTVTG